MILKRKGEAARCGGSHATCFALCRGTRPPQWLPVVATAVALREAQRYAELNFYLCSGSVFQKLDVGK